MHILCTCNIPIIDCKYIVTELSSSNIQEYCYIFPSILLTDCSEFIRKEEVLQNRGDTSNNFHNFFNLFKKKQIGNVCFTSVWQESTHNKETITAVFSEFDNIPNQWTIKSTEP